MLPATQICSLGRPRGTGLPGILHHGKASGAAGPLRGAGPWSSRHGRSSPGTAQAVGWNGRPGTSRLRMRQGRGTPGSGGAAAMLAWRG